MIVACSDCALEQRIPELPPRGIARCARCDKPLKRGGPHNVNAALGAVIAGLLLLLVANLLPLMRSFLRDMEREGYLYEAALIYWQDGFWLLAVMIGLFVLVFPILRSAMLTAILGCVHFGRRPAWLGRYFRYSEQLRYWSIPAVLLLAGIVTYGRISAQLSVEIAMGGYAFISATLLLFIADRTFSRREVWRFIRDDPVPPPNEPRVVCGSCDLVVASSDGGKPCPRCGHRLTRRKPDAMKRTMAFTAAAYLLYPISYIYPMSYDLRPTGIQEHTIFSGIARVFSEGFWYFGILIFFASVAVPMLKLLGLTWAMIRVRWPTRRGLLTRTRIYRTVHEIGPWSNLDPLIVALNASVIAYVGIAEVEAGMAALTFALVVSLTQLASHTFDPRLMWDAAEMQEADDGREEGKAAAAG